MILHALLKYSFPLKHARIKFHPDTLTGSWEIREMYGICMFRRRGTITLATLTSGDHHWELNLPDHLPTPIYFQLDQLLEAMGEVEFHLTKGMNPKRKP